MPHQLPQLPYSYDALEPWIDARTMEIHHGKHHQGYVDNLNKALEQAPDLAETLEELLGSLEAVPEAIRMAVRNHGGGHFNHSLFWTMMKPGGGALGDMLEDALKKTFGSVDAFKGEFAKAAMGRFGSGWAWLVRDASGVMKITSTANQDTPISEGFTPLLGLDVWEHAYYLKYQNRRAEYVEAWWNVVNWEEVARRMGE